MKFKIAVLTIFHTIGVISCTEKNDSDGNIKTVSNDLNIQNHSEIQRLEFAAEKIQSILTEIAQSLFSQKFPKHLTKGEEWDNISKYFDNTSEESRKVKVSIHSINNKENTIHSESRIELKAQSNDKGFIGVIASFNCDCERTDDQDFKIKSISDPYDIVFNKSSELWFTDETDTVAGDEPVFNRHLSNGLDHWLMRVESVHGIDAFINNGLAVGDFNGDGLDDLYVCQPGGLPNRLLLHTKDGKVVSAQVLGCDYLDHTSSALFVDIDNDGDQDLCLATPSGIVLLENDNAKRFISRGVLQTDDVDCHSLTATDYDLDGNLDLYITFALGSIASENGTDFQFNDARDGGSNQLFKGNGNWSFSEVTSLTGLSEKNNRHSLAAAWHDHDRDGDPDLYIANDYGVNQLYRNDLKNGKRAFIEIAQTLGVEDRGAGMSVSWGDFNRDGLSDIYVGNMYSSAGNRITRMPSYLSDENVGLTEVYQRFAKGNTLLVQNNSGNFYDYGQSVSMGRWAWSSVFADIDNDGWEDIVVANGYITGSKKDDL